MLLFPILKPPIPILYKVAHSVVAPLDTHTDLTDARRDGSAAGISFGRMVNSVQSSSIFILRGKVRRSPTTYSDGNGDPLWTPYALLGGNRFAVTRFSEDSRKPVYFSATVAPTFSVSRTRLARRPATAKRIIFGEYGNGRDFPASWRTSRLRPGEHVRPFKVAYARSPRGVVFGNGLVDTASGDMFDLDPKYVAILRRNGAEYKLKEFVKGNPDLGQIVWVSPEGWLVCAAYRGETRKLAWLEPVRG